MWAFARKKLELPAPGEALPGRATPMPLHERALRERAAARRRRSRPGSSRRSSASAASGGPSACFWQQKGVYSTAVGYAGGHTPNPTLRGGVQRRHRPHRGGARRVRPQGDQLRQPAQALLGEPRPHPGHAPGQRCRHAVPLGDLHLRRRRSSSAAEASRDAYQKRLAAAGYGADHDRDPPGAALLLRRGLPPAIPRQESRTATAGSAERASPVRSASVRRSEHTHAVSCVTPTPTLPPEGEGREGVQTGYIGNRIDRRHW